MSNVSYKVSQTHTKYTTSLVASLTTMCQKCKKSDSFHEVMQDFSIMSDGRLITCAWIDLVIKNGKKS